MTAFLRVATQISVFLIAGFVFFFGLGVGLSFNSTLGTLLLLAAGLIAAANVWWILRSPRSR